jgi:hypothetical protein
LLWAAHGQTADRGRLGLELLPYDTSRAPISDRGSEGVSEGHDKGLDGPGIADLAERPGGSLAHVLVVVADGVDERLDGPGIADLHERHGGSPAHVLVLQCGDKGLDSPGIAALAERRGGSTSLLASDVAKPH